MTTTTTQRPVRRFYDNTTYDSPGMWVDQHDNLWFGPGLPNENLHFAVLAGFDCDNQPVWVYKASELPDGIYLRINTSYPAPAPADISLQASVNRLDDMIEELRSDCRSPLVCDCAACDLSRVLQNVQTCQEAAQEPYERSDIKGRLPIVYNGQTAEQWYRKFVGSVKEIDQLHRQIAELSR